MAWNDWYTHYDRITDNLMRQAADAMIASGMADARSAVVELAVGLLRPGDIATARRMVAVEVVGPWLCGGCRPQTRMLSHANRDR